MITQESVTGKEPWLAVILSGIFPGMGQIYADQLGTAKLDRYFDQSVN